MSLYRFVYYSAVVAGWAAFLAWMVAEGLLLGDSEPGTVRTAVVGAVLGAFIGGGLNLVSVVAHAQWKGLVRRLSAGLASGAAGGAVGAAIGDLLVRGELSQALGWMIMGLAIGGSEGLFEGSRSKLRNGLIGGGLGGFVGGWLFVRIAAGQTDMTGRACGFVVLGILIGVFIGLNHVVLKEAWLTVVDGFRPGRELILGQRVTVLGRGDHLPLPLLGYAARDLESEHATITRDRDGSFSIQDNHSRLGTLLNGQAVGGATPLSDGDLIKLGGNIVRFRVHHGGAKQATDSIPEPTAAATGPIAPPPGVPPGPPTIATPPPDSSAPNPRIPPPPPPSS